MRILKYILFLFVTLFASRQFLHAESLPDRISFDFYGDTIELNTATVRLPQFNKPLSEDAILEFYNSLKKSRFEPVVASLLRYRDTHQPDDWLFYHLIRSTAQTFSPKGDHYVRYTLYKWFFLLETGYDARLSIRGDTILFYVQCDENIYDVPYFMSEGKQFVCLNYHDYGYNLDLAHHPLQKVSLTIKGCRRSFSYRLTKLPRFRPGDYREKMLQFRYHDQEYKFRVQINEQIKRLFINYPVADYHLYFNTPLSKETYASLIPQLKENMEGMDMNTGLDYLMRFSRYAFAFKKDMDVFGKEKRLLPEQTLLYEESDCEDRAALFFALVRDIYNLPMIVLVYPEHVTIAVSVEKASGKPVVYNGRNYYVCEPTPQKKELGIGQLPAKLANQPYEIAYSYQP